MKRISQGQYHIYISLKHTNEFTRTLITDQENLRFRKTSYRHRCSFENGENRSQLLKLEQNRGRDQT